MQLERVLCIKTAALGARLLRNPLIRATVSGRFGASEHQSGHGTTTGPTGDIIASFLALTRVIDGIQETGFYQSLSKTPRWRYTRGKNTVGGADGEAITKTPLPLHVIRIDVG